MDRFQRLILKEGVSESESIAQNRPLKSRDTCRSNHMIHTPKAVKYGPEK